MWEVHRVLSSFERLDDTFNDRAEKLLESLVGATNTLTDVLEAAAVSLDKVNIRKELDNIPKAPKSRSTCLEMHGNAFKNPWFRDRLGQGMITLAIPFIILIIELAVSNVPRLSEAQIQCRRPIMASCSPPYPGCET